VNFDQLNPVGLLLLAYALIGLVLVIFWAAHRADCKEKCRHG
jgi:hypothetical protein